MKHFNVKIDSLSFGGEGIARVDGKVCFVKGALPGEEVSFLVSEESARYIKGYTEKIFSMSPDRMEPKCAYYGKCGGCHLQHLSYEKELFYKRQEAVELMKRIGGLKDFNFEGALIEPSNKFYNYRSSITLHKNDKGKFGFFSTEGKDILPIDYCPIAEESINKEIKNIASSVKNSRVTLKADYLTKVFMSGRLGDRFFEDKYLDKNLVMSPRAFSQCNRYIAEKIAVRINEWGMDINESSGFFDVYSGVGFFSFLLNKNFKARIGIDSESIAIDCAKASMKKFFSKENFKFYRGEAEKEFFGIFSRNKLKNNIVLLDPPRSGLDRRFLEPFKKMKDISRIFYISCDPASLARDIKILTLDSDWKLSRLSFFDMFPRTYHIETLAEFTR
ncbi:RNA methyltransferase, TrmA family [Candidatus Omnitrophus magneticus]|uniref:RNA methyltransferase, TrmA family n=1 Tax=Candidatus Omnitrophus magneticus TaxID=1609969 RepID=A0A0F0CV49_9BACT|nr:RNA methyltransferase, TrmA family [Candidatus Omnitrophus magneticus]